MIQFSLFLFLLAIPLMAQSDCTDTDQDGDGWTIQDGDCDDSDAAIHPGATEICDLLDNDCDGVADDGIPGASAACATESCAELLELNPEAETGSYWLDFFSDGNAVEVRCDMSTEGGGWTEITLELAYLYLEGTLEYTQYAGIDGIDSSYRPYAQDTTNPHSYTYTFQFPAGFSGFFLSNFITKAYAGEGHYSDIYGPSFTQSDWDWAYGDTWGDVSFGSADEVGPVTSYAVYFTSSSMQCEDCEIGWPGGSTLYSVSSSTAFRIGFGDEGGEYEGWYPWWSGTIYVR